MCRLLWNVLRGADNAQVDQILNYNNNDFNNVGLYLPDGGTDIEELADPGSKVQISVTASLLEQLLCFGQAGSLRLKFCITYKVQTEARVRATAFVTEDVTIFRVIGSPSPMFRRVSPSLS
jgi:hypothetical protein